MAVEALWCVRFDADFAGGHQFVNRAAIGHAQQFLALSVGQYTFKGEGDMQGVFAFLFLAVVALHFDAHASQRDVFFFAYIFTVSALQAPSAASK